MNIELHWPSPEPKPTRAPKQPVPVRRENLDRLFLYQRGQVSWDQVAGFRGGPQRKGHRLMLWSWLAVCIDGLLLFSSSVFFLIAFALIVKSPLKEILPHAFYYGPMKLFIGLFLVVSWAYMVITRIMFGFSVGEWACDLRLGQPTQRIRDNYPWLVMARATAIVLSGLCILPILSWFRQKDLAGEISGVKLISLK